jgi:hypothetical protein
MFNKVIKIKVPVKYKYGWELLDTQKGKYRHIQMPRSGQEFKVEFIGNSRVDGNPMFTLLSTGQISFDSIKSIITHWRFIQAFSDLGNEFEPVENFENVMTAKVDIEFTECNNSVINQWMKQWLKFNQSEIDENRALERAERLRGSAKSLASDIIPVMPMSFPSNHFFYIDYVYGESRYNLTEQQLKYLLLSL